MMKRGLGMSCKEMADVFAGWNKGVLDSFLIEITRDILYYNDDDGTPLVEKILDAAGQKGTGKWTAINALDMGQPVTLIGEAVFARCLSSLKPERERASKNLHGPKIDFSGDKKKVIDNLEQALYASKIISYAQGFMLMQAVRVVQSSFPLPAKASNLANPCLFTGRQRIQLVPKQARNRPHVARWLHHPLRLPQKHHLGLPRRPPTREPPLQ